MFAPCRVTNDAPVSARKPPGPTNTLFFAASSKQRRKQYMVDEMPILDVDEVGRAAGGPPADGSSGKVLPLSVQGLGWRA